MGALTLGLAACGSDDSGSAADASVPSSSTTEPETTEPETTDVETTEPETTEPIATAVAETRTVEHVLGTSEVPVDPQRVVVVDRRGTLPFLLELGVEPVGALEATWLFGEPFHPMIADVAEAADVEPIDGTDGPNLEQIAELQPDLIIGNVRDMAETEDLLAEIAPTIGLQWDFEDTMANAVTIGAALGLEDEAQALVDDFDTALAEAASGVTDPGTVSIIGLFAPDDIRIYRSANLFGQLTEQLGGEIVPSEEVLAINPDDGEVNDVSLEEIGLANGERIISFVNLSPESDAIYREFEQEALVQALPAYRSGQVLEADPQLGFGAAGSTGLHAILEQLVAFYNS